MPKQSAKNDISLPKQIALHLLPGVLIVVAYLGMGWLFYKNGYPAIFGFFLAALFVQIPTQIGLPIYLERRNGARFGAKKVFLFRERQPFWQVTLLAVGCFVWAGLVFMLAGPALVNPLREGLFSGVPQWFDLGEYLVNPAYSQPVRGAAWVVGIVFGAFVGPIIEEFYFRGYLLPRMSALKAWAPLLGAVLFSLYHFWSPWLFVLRVIALLPLVYAVWWKRNITIGIGAHVLLNLVGDGLLALPLVFGP